MKSLMLFSLASTLGASACLDLDKAYDEYCAAGRCDAGQGGTADGGSAADAGDGDAGTGIPDAGSPDGGAPEGGGDGGTDAGPRCPRLVCRKELWTWPMTNWWGLNVQAPEDVWVAGGPSATGGSVALRWNGDAGWDAGLNQPGGNLRAIAGPGGAMVAGGDQEALFHEELGSWSKDMGPTQGEWVYDCAATATEAVCVGSGGVIIARGGSAASWLREKDTDVNGALSGVATSGGAWLAVGERNGNLVTLSRDGGAWLDAGSAAGAARSVWMTSPRDAWLVGDDGLVMRRVPGGWERVDAGTTLDLNSVWGSGPSDVWAVGVGGTVLHFDGGTWTTVATTDLLTTQYVRVAGLGRDELWLVGYDFLGGTNRTAHVLRLQRP